MGKIKKLFKKKSIKTAFVVYMLVCILSALFFSLVLSNICQFGQSQIYKKYQTEYEKSAYYFEMENQDSNNSHGVLSYYTYDIRTLFTPFELSVYDMLGIFSIACYPICFILCISITSMLFYKKQLQKPLEMLSNAADNITDNNLDFSIAYDKENELGKLCASFEKMRVSLKDNNLEMWRQVEERKRLNAAFAHDLRTPLTVLKGQSEMLAQYAPKMSEDKIISTAEMMKRHIIRLEAYVNTMNNLQRLEDVEIKKELVVVKEIEKQMRTTGTAVCAEKEFIFQQNIPSMQNVTIDISIIMQVYENLLSNALRYAESKIEVSVEEQDSLFILTIADDGVGFTAKDLSNVMKPFYKAESETNNEHFGMGLNICKTLCEKHGGYLQILNENGAKVVAIFKE